MPKDMPLPFRVKPRKPGGSSIYNRLHPTQVKEEEQNYPDLAYLGEGGVGIAYTTQGKVLKYTPSAREAGAAQYAQNHPCPCVVAVHNIRQIPAQTGYPVDVFAITIDQLAPLPKHEGQIVTVASLIVGGHTDTAYMNTWKKITSRPENRALAKEALEFNQCLVQNGYQLTDVHGSNVGRDTEGHLRLFDLGESRSSLYASTNWLHAALGTKAARICRNCIMSR